MLSREYRLTKNNDFARVAQRGRAAFGREISLKWIRNGLNHSRFGIVVSLKIDKRATVRNKIKRRIRAILKKHLSEFVSGYDFLFLTQPMVKELDYHGMEAVIMKIVEKRGLKR